MHKLLIILSFCSYITCDDICGEDGLYINPGDNTSYYECDEGKPTFMRCPRTLDGYAFKIFDGNECVDNRRVSRQTGTEDIEPNYQAQQPEVSCPFGRACPYQNSPQQENRLSIGPPECPSGSKYDSIMGKCLIEEFVDPIRDTVSTDYQTRTECPPGSIYDASTRKCRIEEFVDPIREIASTDYQTRTECPSGSTYDSNTGKCQIEEFVEPIVSLEAINLQSRPVCPTGSTFDYRTGKCRIIRYVDPTKTVTYQCPTGYTYDRNTGKCRRIELIDPTDPNRCRPGYTYDSNTGQCIVTPDCRQPKHCYNGFILDIATNQCCKQLEIPSIQIPGIINYTCPAGFTYDRVMKECRWCIREEPQEIPEPDNTTCPEQFVYILETRKCQKRIWVKPIFNYALCICPPGYEWRPRMFKCVRLETQECKEAPCPLARVPQTHICPIGETYDFSQQRCRGYPRVAPKPPKTCPAGCPKGFTQDYHSQNCSAFIYIDPIIVPGKKTYNCRPDYEYDPVLHKCIYCRKAPVIEIPGQTTRKCPNEFIINFNNMCTKQVCMPLQPTIGQLPCYCPPGTEWRYHMFQCIKIFEQDCIDGQCPPVPTYTPYYGGGPTIVKY